jgi:hypothetical protein
VLSIRFRNVSTNSVRLFSSLSAEDDLTGLSFVLLSPSGTTTQIVSKADGSGCAVRLGPRALEYHFDFSRLYEFREAGTFTITAQYGEFLTGFSNDAQVVSNPLRVVMGRPD